MVTAACIAWASVAACASTASGGGSNTNWVECESDAKCAAGERCVDRRCTKVDAGRTIPLEGGPRESGADGAPPIAEAGPDAGNSDCPAASQSQPSIVCSKQLGDWASDGGSRFPIVGTVTEIVPGTNVCSVDAYGGFSGTWQARIWDGNRGIQLGLPTPWPIVKVGDVLWVQSAYKSNVFAPTESYTEVRTNDGKLLYWSAQSGDLGSLRTPPEITVTGGDVRCVGSSECGTWHSRALRLSVAGETKDVGGGEVGQVGEFSVTSGGASEQTSSTGCFDWYVADVRVAAIRSTALAASQVPKCGGAVCSSNEYCEPPAGDACFSLETGACRSRPTACGTDCPGICGCDARFYCSDCFAQMRGTVAAPGFTDCMRLAPTCPGSGTGTADSWCEWSWNCKTPDGYPYPVDYAVRCDASGGTNQCDCKEDGVTVRSVTIPSLSDPRVCSYDARDACGFPKTISGL